MSTYTKAWKVTGYAVDGRAYCPPCMDVLFHGAQNNWMERLLKFSENITPVFASDEHSLSCERCTRNL
jgi:hypothetical protein